TLMKRSTPTISSTFKHLWRGSLLMSEETWRSYPSSSYPNVPRTPRRHSWKNRPLFGELAPEIMKLASRDVAESARPTLLDSGRPPHSACMRTCTDRLLPCVRSHRGRTHMGQVHPSSRDHH